MADIWKIDSNTAKSVKVITLILLFEKIPSGILS
jgi:hypothetical protein